MRLCVNGHWMNDVCRCLDFWRGESCDERDCGPFAIRNDTASSSPTPTPPSDQPICHCQDGYAGEFCQFEVCLHRNRWYCNATRGTDPTDWYQERRLCPPPVESLLDLPTNLTSSHCDCGFGVITTGASLQGDSNSTCLCASGFYGEFCQWSLCPRGEQWDSTNKTCVLYGSSSSSNSTRARTNLGFFGYDLNVEFDVSAAICVALVLIFVIVGRLLLKYLERRAAQNAEYNYHMRRRSTFTEYYDRFYRQPQQMNGRNGTRVRKQLSTETQMSSSSDHQQNTIISTSAGGWRKPIVVIPYQHEPRPLETVYEGISVVSKPSMAVEDGANTTHDSRFRESTSSDMSIGSSNVTID